MTPIAKIRKELADHVLPASQCFPARKSPSVAYQYLAVDEQSKTYTLGRRKPFVPAIASHSVSVFLYEFAKKNSIHERGDLMVLLDANVHPSVILNYLDGYWKMGTHHNAGRYAAQAIVAERRLFKFEEMGTGITAYGATVIPSLISNPIRRAKASFANMHKHTDIRSKAYQKVKDLLDNFDPVSIEIFDMGVIADDSARAHVRQLNIEAAMAVANQQSFSL